jgi:hypothetical protein
MDVSAARGERHFSPFPTRPSLPRSLLASPSPALVLAAGRVTPSCCAAVWSTVWSTVCSGSTQCVRLRVCGRLCGAGRPTQPGSCVELGDLLAHTAGELGDLLAHTAGELGDLLAHTAY